VPLPALFTVFKALPATSEKLKDLFLSAATSPATFLPMIGNLSVGLHLKCQLLLSDFDQNWNVPTNFSKTLHYQIS
jgi:hypothetical protein